MFVYVRLAALIIVVTQKTSSPAVQKRHSKVYGNPIAPSLYSILLDFKSPYKVYYRLPFIYRINGCINV